MICRVCHEDLPEQSFAKKKAICRACESHEDRERRYGITREEYEALYEWQGGKCAICRAPRETLVVDHCHKTNEARFLLCNGCNSGLGQFKDSIAIALRAAAYLRGIARKRIFT